MVFCNRDERFFSRNLDTFFLSVISHCIIVFCYSAIQTLMPAVVRIKLAVSTVVSKQLLLDIGFSVHTELLCGQYVNYGQTSLSG